MPEGLLEEVKKVEFTPEQQAKLDEIVESRMAAARKEADAEAKAARKAAKEASEKAEAAEAALAAARASGSGEGKTEIEKLQAEIAEMKVAGESTKNEQKRLEKLLKDKDKLVEEANTKVSNVHKGTAMRDAAANFGFVDSADVIALTGSSVSWSDEHGRFVVLNEKGQPKLNSTYEPMTLDEFYKDYAAKKPHLVRTDFRGGAGSSASNRGEPGAGKYKLEDVFGKNSKGAQAVKLNKENPALYREMKQAAIAAGLID